MNGRLSLDRWNARRAAFFLAGALALTLAANAAQPKTPGKIGVYCKLNDEAKSPALLGKTFADMKAAGVDFICFYAKNTSGAVGWKSAVAPAKLSDPSDFMGAVTKAAHEAGLKVYPVFCVATEGGDNKLNAVLEKNPSWAYVSEGKPIGYIDPGNVEARKYEISLIAELMRQHEVDGFSLDYMRCPNRVGYCESGRAEFLKRKNVDLAKLVGMEKGALETEGGVKAMKDASAKARKDPIWAEYQQWRREQLNGFMREIYNTIQQARPGLPISTYCWGAQTYGPGFETCQDWKTWIKEGWLSWINPSGYRYTDEEFRSAAQMNRDNVPKGFPYYVTIGVETSHGKLPDLAALRKQMAISKQVGADGLVFFTWESLKKFLPEVASDLKQW